MKTSNKEDVDALRVIHKAIDEKLGFDIKLFDVSKDSSLADYFIIASVNNQSQLKSVADHVEEKVKELGIKLKGREGITTSGWILLDFFTFVVHIFEEEDRALYTLDEIWKDSPEIEIEL